MSLIACIKFIFIVIVQALFTQLYFNSYVHIPTEPLTVFNTTTSENLFPLVPNRPSLLELKNSLTDNSQILEIKSLEI